MVISLTFVALFGAACGSGADAEPTGAGDSTMDQPQEESSSSSSNEVALQGIAFVPADLTVEAGIEVSLVNEDDVDHTVTSGTQREQGVPGVEEDRPAKPDGMLDEALPGSGDSFDFTFDQPGTYAYYCDVHAGMTGEITVE